MNLVTLLVFSVTLIDQSSCLCDDYNATDTRANQCYELIRSMEDSLLQDKGNILRLQNAFFYSPTANPVLLKVDYIVTFNEVFTMWTSGESPGINASSESMYCNQPDPHNTTIIDLNETLISRGWTSSGVYTLFHPGVLNLMQLQLPYILLNLIQSSTVQSTDGPEADSFLWDGSFELPTLRLNLHISHLNCLPSQDLFNAVLDKITSQLRLYARREPVLSFETSLNDLGFALDNSTITVRGIPHDDGSHVVVNFYHFFVSFVYFFCVGGFFVFYKKSGTHSADGKEEADFKVKIDNFFKRHHKVVPGAAIVATLSVLSELGIRFVRCITWTVYIIRDDSVHRAHDQGINGFIAVWLPQLWLILLVLTPNLIIHCIYFRIGCKQERCYAQNSKLCFCWMMFYNKVNVHIVLVSCLFSYLLIYASFPTFILIFAYPTRMIAVVTFVLAFLFSMTILFSILAHFYILAKPAEFRRQNFKKLAFYTIIFIFLALLLSTVIIVYFFGLLYVLLYVLVIGRASVVSNGPLAFLSLLPSAILSGLAWTAKRIFLNSDTEEPNKHPVRNQSPVDPPYPGNNWEVAKKDDIVPLAFPMHTRTSCPDMLEQLQQENVLKLRH